MTAIFLIYCGLLGAQLYLGVTFYVDRGSSWVAPRTSAWVVHRIDEPELFWSVIARQLLLFAVLTLLHVLTLHLSTSTPAVPWTP